VIEIKAFKTYSVIDNQSAQSFCWWLTYARKYRFIFWLKISLWSFVFEWKIVNNFVFILNILQTMSHIRNINCELLSEIIAVDNSCNFHTYWISNLIVFFRSLFRFHRLYKKCNDAFCSICLWSWELHYHLDYQIILSRNRKLCLFMIDLISITISITRDIYLELSWIFYRCDNFERII
jgi:hypothetical protein